MSARHLSAGTAARDHLLVDLDPVAAGVALPGWSYAGLQVLDLAPGTEHPLDTGGTEVLVLPLAGSPTVAAAGRTYPLAGRTDPFAGPSDHLYLPPGTTAVLAAPGGARVALASARVDGEHSVTEPSVTELPVTHRPAGAAGVELRGAGICSRRVIDYCVATDLPTHHLMVCEVITPAGNWSSYPPHKHDEHTAAERALEEVYYYEVRPGPGGPGFALQRAYGTADHPLDLTAEIRTGDVVLLGHGYHGPTVAAPGHDLYYLNVMAGPARDRTWLATDDPAHHWVRGTWVGADVDPRLKETP